MNMLKLSVGLFSSVLCCHVLSLEAGTAAENIEVAHARLFREFVRPEGLLCDYVGEIPTPKDCAEGRPNAIGWCSPIENGPMFTGPYLKACLQRARRLRGTPRFEQALKECVHLAAGLIHAASVSDVKGMVVRGVGTDGKCHYPIGSEDQTLPWFFGLHAYVTSDVIPKPEREKARAKMKEVADAIEANNLDCPCDGRFKGHVSGSFRDGALPFRYASHALFFFAAMQEVTGEAKWRDYYVRCRDQKNEKFGMTGVEMCESGWEPDKKSFKVEQWGVWIYVAAQGCLAELVRMEKDPEISSRYRKGLMYNAERAKRCGLLWRAPKYDNRMERPFRFANWRTGYKWRDQPTEADANKVAMSGDKNILGNRREHERDFMTMPLSAASVCGYAGQYREEIERVIACYDFNEVNLCEFFLAEVAWESVHAAQ